MSTDAPSIIGRGLLLTTWLRTPTVAVVNGDCLGGGARCSSRPTSESEEHARFWLPEDEARPIENRYSAMVMRSNDAKEGMRAFIEKRPASFTGT